MNMKKLLIFTGLILANFVAQAQLPEPVATALKKAGVAESGVSVFVQQVNGKKPSLSVNAGKRMNPASVMKLVTTYAGLELLKPTFRWKTEVYSEAMLENGLLNGDIILKGYGDPSFKEDEFRRLLVSLRQKGIKNIAGDFVIDKTYFAEKVGVNRTFDSERWRAYNALPSAFLVNGRHTSFKFVAHDGEVIVSQEVELPEVEIVNQMQLRQGGCGSWRNHYTYDVKTSKRKAVVTFKGTFSASCGDRWLELSVFDDEQYAFFMFKKLWAEVGGTFNGRLRTQQAMPVNATKLLEQGSKPLAVIVRDINKWSNNVMARQLLLTIAAEETEQPASEVRGMLAIKSWLRGQGRNTDSLIIENGSGLSRIERVAAKDLGQMLIDAYQGSTMPELMSSLPILSLDGTLRKRLRNMPVSAQAHMKTGSIRSVKAIAGYVLDEKGRRNVVVMMVNDTKAAYTKSAQDELINWVYHRP